MILMYVSVFENEDAFNAGSSCITRRFIVSDRVIKTLNENPLFEKDGNYYFGEINNYFISIEINYNIFQGEDLTEMINETIKDAEEAYL